jgi:hypothetical protein
MKLQPAYGDPGQAEHAGETMVAKNLPLSMAEELCGKINTFGRFLEEATRGEVWAFEVELQEKQECLRGVLT